MSFIRVICYLTSVLLAPTNRRILISPARLTSLLYSTAGPSGLTRLFGIVECEVHLTMSILQGPQHFESMIMGSAFANPRPIYAKAQRN